MSGHVLIVDSVAARRVLMRASLRAAHYDVSQGSEAAEAPALVAQASPDVLLLDLGHDEERGIAAIRALRDQPGDPAGAHPSVIALTPPDRPDLRLAALEAGACEAMAHDASDRASDRLLKARIRSLLRARDDTAEMGLREEDGSALSLADDRLAFVRPAAWRCEGRVAVVVPGGAGEASAGRALPEGLALLPSALSCEVSVLSAGDPMGGAHEPVPDLFVIDGSEVACDPGAGAEVLRLLADLRSRSLTRHAATLVVLPPEAADTAAMALDLGAGDVAEDGARPEELATRARALIGRKSQADRLRDRIQSRLQAAVRDPLTGLYNRRYAEPMLQRMAARAGAAGREFAMMVLDIDHFKAINDTYGHAAGDRVLAEVAARLQAGVRAGDLVARIGGEEFLVALADTTPEAARSAGERLRHAIEQQPFLAEPGPVRDGPGPGGPGGPVPQALPSRRWRDPARADEAPPVRRAMDHLAGATLLTAHRAPVQQERQAAAIRVTLSVGVAVGAADPATGGFALAALFEQADAALYAAKTAGRNTVAVAPAAA